MQAGIPDAAALASLCRVPLHPGGHNGSVAGRCGRSANAPGSRRHDCAARLCAPRVPQRGRRHAKVAGHPRIADAHRASGGAVDPTTLRLTAPYPCLPAYREKRERQMQTGGLRSTRHPRHARLTRPRAGAVTVLLAPPETVPRLRHTANPCASEIDGSFRPDIPGVLVAIDAVALACKLARYTCGAYSALTLTRLSRDRLDPAP